MAQLLCASTSYKERVMMWPILCMSFVVVCACHLMSHPTPSDHTVVQKCVREREIGFCKCFL
jgi:hypothetical protein